MNNSVLNHEGPVVVTEVYDAPNPFDLYHLAHVKEFFDRPLPERLVCRTVAEYQPTTHIGASA